jgi:hypothetical protein
MKRERDRKEDIKNFSPLARWLFIQMYLLAL